MFVCFIVFTVLFYSPQSAGLMLAFGGVIYDVGLFNLFITIRKINGRYRLVTKIKKGSGSN